ncbi:hypothetical protein BDB00DRAFT_874718 [Zychaea mexicana]|uniref:uncharacterized protein n=1 Tax=Zychaea mexicana TaxID=64656 RepID=UPI0022FE5215|nr:uncharacterized protein BDB00DRAFT_874718 [Zychaea mexicana]KAI9491026.1 hypothetical protein BDB00DRAFT_874718 [Zychaea mexicana]
MNNNNQPSRMNANANQGIGNVKETAGNMMGNDRMKAEGQGQNTGGKMEEMGAKANEMWQNAKNKAEGAFNGASKGTGQNN